MTSEMIRRFLPLLLVLIALANVRCEQAGGLDPAAMEDPEQLHAAVKKLTDVMVYDIFSPPQASRVYAYTSVAAYEALAPGRPEYQSLAGQLSGLEPLPQPDQGETYSLPLASLHAFLMVGQAMIFSEDEIAAYRDGVHEQYRKSLPGDVYKRSVDYGEQVAQHILAWADADRYKESRSYPKFTVTDEPGRWQPTPPAYMDGIEPHWNAIRPFVLDSASQFMPPRPVPFSIEEGSAFFEEVQTVYETGVEMSEEERAIAAFWDCNPYVMHLQGHAMFATKKITPGGHWIGITAIANRQAGADLMQSAEAYARVSTALADGFISSWDEKYRSNLIRPETVINAHLDEAWQPLLQTPPFPEYTSGHSVISAAAATALTDLYGDHFAFNDTSEVEYGLPARAFSSFNEAAEEAAVSRLYGGIHYPMAIENGLDQGRGVGHLVIDRVQTRMSALATR